MHKSKTKPASFWSVHSLLFIVLWGGIYGAAWFGLYALLQVMNSILDWPQQQTDLVAIFSVSLLAVIAQVQVAERVLKHSMRGWTLYSIYGLLLTFAANEAVHRLLLPESVSFAGNLRLLFILMAVLLPVPLFQALWLRSRVHSAWRWPLITLVAAWIVAFNQADGNNFLFIAVLLHGFVQGAMMRYLWTQPLGTEKAKVDFDIDEHSSIDNRAARLQTSDSLPATWHSRDDHAAQRRDQ